MKNSEFLWSFLLLAISTLVLSLPARAAVEAALEQCRKSPRIWIVRGGGPI